MSVPNTPDMSGTDSVRPPPSLWRRTPDSWTPDTIGDGMTTSNWYEDKAPKREARLAETYRQDDFLDRLEKMNEEHPEKVSSTQRIAIGHYQAARDAARRVGGDA